MLNKHWPWTLDTNPKTSIYVYKYKLWRLVDTFCIFRLLYYREKQLLYSYIKLDFTSKRNCNGFENWADIRKCLEQQKTSLKKCNNENLLIHFDDFIYNYVFQRKWCNTRVNQDWHYVQSPTQVYNIPEQKQNKQYKLKAIKIKTLIKKIW